MLRGFWIFSGIRDSRWRLVNLSTVGFPQVWCRTLIEQAAMHLLVPSYPPLLSAPNP